MSVVDKYSQLPGFIASLLRQGDKWDIRCVDADMRAYHTEQYTRMAPTAALEQELQLWINFVQDEQWQSLPLYQERVLAGFTYLHWQATEVFPPMSDAEKLSKDMIIHLNPERYLYKVEDALTLFDEQGEVDRQMLLHAFPVQLLTYAACCTIDKLLQEPSTVDMSQWAEMMLGWVQYPSEIHLQDVCFEIPDVYTLYSAYVDFSKAQWQTISRRWYQSQPAQPRAFLSHLLQYTKEQCALANKLLADFLTPKQQQSFARYLTECLQYIKDHTSTRRKLRSNQFEQYWCEGITTTTKQAALRAIKSAVLQPQNPAAALALTVKRLQRDGVLRRELRPLTQFVEIVNTTFGSNLKHDTFSKHFR